MSRKETTSLVFIDETSAYVGKSREYGWAASSERVDDSRPKGKKERVSLIAALSFGGIMAEQALVIPGTVNKNAFLAFLESTLLPTLASGSVSVLDNWSAKHPEGTVHHAEEVRSLVETYGCELLYLPTYSPDLNPIEHLFAKLKALIKSLRPQTMDNIIQAFCEALKAVTSRQVFSTFKHCKLCTKALNHGSAKKSVRNPRRTLVMTGVLLALELAFTITLS